VEEDVEEEEEMAEEEEVLEEKDEEEEEEHPDLLACRPCGYSGGELVDATHGRRQIFKVSF
jgi:hypothetical protein